MSARRLRHVITIVVVSSAALLIGTGTSSALDLDGAHIGGHDGVAKGLTDLGRFTSDREIQVP